MTRVYDKAVGLLNTAKYALNEARTRVDNAKRCLRGEKMQSIQFLGRLTVNTHGVPFQPAHLWEKFGPRVLVHDGIRISILQTGDTCIEPDPDYRAEV